MLLTKPSTKRARAIFPYRSPSGGTQPTLPSCRAWRVIARPAADFAAAAAVVAAGKAPAAPSGCFDGVYPVWVRLTRNGGEEAELLLVDGDGWNLAPTGPDWRIEYIGGGAAAADRFAFVVETIDDVAEAGQVNAPAIGAAAQTLLHGAWETNAVNQEYSTAILDCRTFDVIEAQFDLPGASARTLVADVFAAHNDAVRSYQTGTLANAAGGSRTLIHIGYGVTGAPNSGTEASPAVNGATGVAVNRELGPFMKFRTGGGVNGQQFGWYIRGRRRAR